MADNTDEINEHARSAINSIAKTLNAGKTVSDAQIRDFLNSVSRVNDAFKHTEFSAKNVSKALGSTVSGLRGFAGGLAGGNTAFSVVNTAIRGVSDTLGNFAKMIPVVGDGIAGLVNQVGKAAEFSVEQIEAGYGAFEQLSDVGLIGSKGIKGLAKDFATAGIPLKTYTALLSNSSQKLAKMNGTAHDVSQTFAESMGQMRGETKKGINGIDNQLRLLGYSTEDISETFINYADLQRRLGNEQQFSSQTLKDGTAAYAKELDLVAKITGMSRKEQQKVVEAAMAESRWRASIEDMSVEQRGNMNALNNGLTAFSSELAQGMRDQATGFTQSSAAQKLFRSTNGESVKIQQQLNAGQITGNQALQEYQQAIKSNMPAMKSLAKATGNQAGIYTDYSKNMDFVTASLGELKTATDTQTNQTKDPDSLTQSTVGAKVALEDANTKIAAMFMDSKNAGKALRGFADAANMAAEAAYNLFLTGDTNRSVRSATNIEQRNNSLQSQLDAAKEELKTLVMPQLLPHSIDTPSPKFSKYKPRVDELLDVIKGLETQIETNGQLIEKETAKREAGKIPLGDILKEYGLINTQGWSEAGNVGYMLKDGKRGIGGGIPLGTGSSKRITPEVADQLRSLFDNADRKGYELVKRVDENFNLWKKVTDLLKPALVDYDSTSPGVQDTAPEQIIKNQTDALNNMGAKLDTIAYNTKTLVKKTEQLVSNMA